jgi:FkbM family methyltransferase
MRKMRAVLPEMPAQGAANGVGGRLLRWTRATLVPKSEVWVQVEHGLAQGLWLRLRLPEETFLWRGDHEPDVQALLGRLRTLRCVAYDVGSYIGFFALGMARRLGPAGRVAAFEPDPGNAARLEEHIARNHMQSQIQVVEAAAWRAIAGNATAYRRGSKARSQGGVEAEGLRPVLASGERILVRSISLDEFIAEGNPAPQLLKIDVEGGECAVLAGAERLITDGRPVIICEIHHAQAARWTEQWLSARDYRMDWLIPAEKFPRRLLAEPASGPGKGP